MSGWGFLRDRYETFMKTLDESLHQKNAFCSQLEKIEEKTKIPRLRLVQGKFLNGNYYHTSFFHLSLVTMG